MAVTVAPPPAVRPGSAGKKDRFIRSNNVAHMIGVSERTVRKWAQSGLLTAYKHGPKIWFFKESDVLAFLEHTRINMPLAGRCLPPGFPIVAAGTPVPSAGG